MSDRFDEQAAAIGRYVLSCGLRECPACRDRVDHIAAALRAVESETLERAAKLCAAEREKGIRAKVHGAWIAACEDLHDAIAGLKSTPPSVDEEKQ